MKLVTITAIPYFLPFFAVTRVVDPADSVFPVKSVASDVYEPQPVITLDSRDNDNDDHDVAVDTECCYESRRSSQ